MTGQETLEPEHDDQARAKDDFPRLRADLEARCKVASIKLEEDEDLDGDKFLKVHLPAGRQTQTLYLFDSDAIRNLLSVQFEKYVHLGDYSAICSYEYGIIEARIATAAPFPTNLLLHRIAGVRADPRGTPKEMPRVEISNPAGKEKLIIGPGSPELASLCGGPGSLRPSLRIEGVTVSRHDHAVEILERLANSFFFQLDLLRNVPVTLMRSRRNPRPSFARPEREYKKLEFPKGEYDREPISLYWYARGARGMPLLQFLAYYQTIEYYFPSYSQAEARRKIRNILKNPGFRAERDTDVARILLAARGGSPGLGDERSQLRATLNECLEPGALREFLSEFEERIQFFSTKAEGLTDHKIPIRNLDADLRNDAADRIYDIRCKVVHTKGGRYEGDVELLLPFSKEAELLYGDIELIQFVAREVLVSASSPLKIRDDLARRPTE